MASAQPWGTGHQWHTARSSRWAAHPGATPTPMPVQSGQPCDPPAYYIASGVGGERARWRRPLHNYTPQERRTRESADHASSFPAVVNRTTIRPPDSSAFIWHLSLVRSRASSSPYHDVDRHPDATVARPCRHASSRYLMAILSPGTTIIMVVVDSVAVISKAQATNAVAFGTNLQRPGPGCTGSRTRRSP